MLTYLHRDLKMICCFLQHHTLVWTEAAADSETLHSYMIFLANYSKGEVAK